MECGAAPAHFPTHLNPQLVAVAYFPPRLSAQLAIQRPQPDRGLSHNRPFYVQDAPIWANLLNNVWSPSDDLPPNLPNTQPSFQRPICHSCSQSLQAGPRAPHGDGSALRCSVVQGLTKRRLEQSGFSCLCPQNRNALLLKAIRQLIFLFAYRAETQNN